MRLLGYLLAVYFVAKTLFFAIAIDPSIPPDEMSHSGLVRVYAEAALRPVDGPDTIALGPIAHQPFLYYGLMGALLELRPPFLSELQHLRFLNVLLGIATLAYAIAWIRLVAARPETRLLFLAFFTNTLMFTALFGSVSYDNLTNALAAASVFHLFRFFAHRQERDLLALCIALLAGCLTKLAFLPLAVLLVVILGVRERKRIREGVRSIGRGARLVRDGGDAAGSGSPASPGARIARGAAFGTAALLLVANLALYGGNLIRYQRVAPSLEQLVGAEAAMDNRIHARNRILRAYREKEIDLQQAIDMTLGIAHPGDRRSTVYLLKLSSRVGDRRAGLPRYAFSWTRLMVQRSFGYFGHRVLARAPEAAIAYVSIFAIALALAIWRGRSGPRAGPLWTCLTIGAGYALFVLLAINHPIYLRTGLHDLAVQGRYLFPVLLPLFGFVALSIGELAPKRAAVVLGMAAGAFFLYGELPFFLLNVEPAWYAWSTP